MEDSKSPLWPSWRLVYTICAFLALVSQQCMNNALNFAILCMIKPNEERGFQNQTAEVHIVRLDGAIPIDEDDSPRGEFNWSRQKEWLLLSSYFYGYMVVQAIAGRLADKLGGKFFLLAGSVGQAITFMLIPIMARTDYWLAVSTRLVQGFLAGFAVPSMYQLYTVWAHANERTVLMSFAYGGYAVGCLLAFPLSSMLCQFEWTYVFYVFGGASFVLGVACYWLVYNTLEAHPWISEKELKYLKEGRDQTKMVPSVPWRRIFTSCPILTFIFTHICHSYGIIVLNIVLPKYLRDTMHFSLKENGYYSSVIHFGGITSKLIVILTFDRLHKKSKLSLTTFRRIVYCCGNVLTTLLLLGITMLTYEHRMLIVVLIYFVGASIDVSFTGAYWVSCIDMAPAFAGLITGISNMASTLSGILAPLAFSSVLTEGTKREWNYFYYSMAFSYALSMIVYGTFGSSEKQQWGDFSAKTTIPELPANIVSKVKN